MIDAIDEELDIRSLRLLQVLLTECSVSRTADKLGKAQPSVSKALMRLRARFGDQLLVRSGQHLIRTENGDRALASVNRVLNEVEAMFDTTEMFEPANCRRAGRIAGADCLALFLLPPLTRRLRELAPQMPIEFAPATSARETLAGLESGRFDLAVGNWPSLPETLRCAPLLEADFVCVVDAEHPLASSGQFSMADYLGLAHLSPTGPDDLASSPVDGRLAQLGLRRRLSVSVPEFSVIPSLIEGTDLVLTTARPLAEHMARSGHLQVVDAPAEFGPMHLSMLWHEHAHASPRNRWLRQTLLTQTRQLAGSGSRRLPPQPASILFAGSLA